MWSSKQEKNNIEETRVVSSSSSSSRSYSSSSSSSAAVLLPQTPRRRIMEEVWKDISIPHPPPISLQHPNSTASNSFRGIIFQDFLAGPFRETPAVSSAPPIPPTEELPLPLPPTILSLNSGLGIDYNSNCSHANNDSNNRNASFISPFFADGIISSPPTAGLFSFCPNKRVIENPGRFGGDRRHKRMMKNRESAARSRARKQAYTNELELEVDHLMAENEKLKKQHEELRSAMAAQHSNKKTLQRTLTAPF